MPQHCAFCSLGRLALALLAGLPRRAGAGKFRVIALLPDWAIRVADVLQWKEMWETFCRARCT